MNWRLAQIITEQLSMQFPQCKPLLTRLVGEGSYAVTFYAWGEWRTLLSAKHFPGVADSLEISEKLRDQK